MGTKAKNPSEIENDKLESKLQNIKNFETF